MKSCKICSKEFKLKNPPGGNGQRYCSNKCKLIAFEKRAKTYKHVRVSCLTCNKIFYAYKGDIERNKGKFCSKECGFKSRIKPLKELICLGCGNKFLRLRYKVNNENTYCSHDCFLKTASAFNNMTGLNHPNWKGGTSHRTFIDSRHRKWRMKVFKRDGFKCVYCGKNGNLQADHLWPFFLVPELRYTIKNGQTLCVDCHRKTFTYGHKYTEFMKALYNKSEMKKCGIKFDVEYAPEKLIRLKREIMSETIYE